MPEANTPPLRIVHYLCDLRWHMGGLMRFVADACAVLAARGNRVDLLTCDAADAPPEWLDGRAGVPRVTVLRRRRPLQLLDGPSLAAAERSIARADVLHLHGPWTPSNLQLAAVARRAGVPYVLTLHGMLDDWSMAQKSLKKRVFHRLFAIGLLERAAAVQCTADYEARQARKWLGRARTVTLLPLVDVSDACSVNGTGLAHDAVPTLRGEQTKVLFVSRLHLKKGVEFLLEAAGVLRRRAVDFRLVLAGEGEPDYIDHLRRRAAELRLDDVVHFFPAFDNRLKQSLYESADVFVLPTHQENFGLVFAEALGMGTPVITTRGVDIWEDLADAGAVIVDRDPEQIADQIVRVTSDRSLWRELSVRGRTWVLRALDPDVIAPRYERLYRDPTRFTPGEEVVERSDETESWDDSDGRHEAAAAVHV